MDSGAGDHSRIIEMAWEDRTPFEAIERLYGLNEQAVIKLMRRELKAGVFVFGERGSVVAKVNTKPCVIRVLNADTARLSTSIVNA